MKKRINIKLVSLVITFCFLITAFVPGFDIEAAAKKDIKLEGFTQMTQNGMAVYGMDKAGRYLYIAGLLKYNIVKYDCVTGKSKNIKVGGNNREAVYPKIKVVGKYIYFVEGINLGTTKSTSCISRIDIDGKHKKILVKGPNNFAIKGNKLYYTKNKVSYVANLNGSHAKKTNVKIPNEVINNEESKYAKLKFVNGALKIKNKKTGKTIKYKFKPGVQKVCYAVIDDCVIINNLYGGWKNEFCVMHYDGKNEHKIKYLSNNK